MTSVSTPLPIGKSSKEIYKCNVCLKYMYIAEHLSMYLVVLTYCMSSAYLV